MNTALRNRITALFAVMAAMLMAIALPGTANAADLHLAGSDHYLTYRVDGEQLFIGVVTQDNSGENYYCIEAGVPVDYGIQEVKAIADSDDARRLAWLMDHYRDGGDKEAQAAIGMMAHDRYDRDQSMWKRHRSIIVQTYPGLQARADELWRQAGEHAPASAAVEQHFIQGRRQGNVEVSVRNADGKPAQGVRYTVSLQGPAAFDGGSTSVSGVSGVESISHAWVATGAGEVSASVTYERAVLDHIVSLQDFVRFAGMKQSAGEVARFTVRKDFAPTISTQVSAKKVDAGQTVGDVVVSGVSSADDDWVPGLALKATGWYFDALPAAAMNHPIAPNAKESASGFLQRLKESGYRPAAFGTATFTGPDQQVEVKATTAADGGQDYLTPDTSGFGTWVWAFERIQQSDEAKSYLLADTVTGFPERKETNTHRGVVRVQSTVSEHSATVGSELSDTITVTGFPDDHGSFTGDEQYGFGADEPLAQVRVWWSGDADDQTQDARYRPETAAEPAADDHHRLIGSWDYEAKNATIRVGAGAKDAHGNPVNIVAKDHGWYVFVWSFAGDDRVMPAASGYDDAWERTRVEEFAVPKAPSITTRVDPDKVGIDEEFRDCATVRGDLDEGAYVEFTAYGAVEPNAEPGSSTPLLDRARAELDQGRGEQTVCSLKTRSPKAGLVYWKATVLSREGDVLTTHELGAPGEIVTVRQPPAPTPERPKLASTGASVAVAVGVTMAAMTTGVVMLIAIRRRSRM